jgi:hypothetical protein
MKAQHGMSVAVDTAASASERHANDLAVRQGAEPVLEVRSVPRAKVEIPSALNPSARPEHDLREAQGVWVALVSGAALWLGIFAVGRWLFG